MLRQLLQSSTIVRSSFSSPLGRSFHIQATALYSSGTQSVTQPSFWKNLVPKPLRKTERDISKRNKGKKAVSKEWNPATFYIWIFLLIGSMSIQMIALKNQHAAFSRRADAKIDLLKEIIERIQNGEDVDVEGLLGTGNAQQEKEWEEVLKDIAAEDESWNEARKKPTRRSGSAARAPPVEEAVTKEEPAQEIKTAKAKSNAPRGFY